MSALRTLMISVLGLALVAGPALADKSGKEKKRGHKVEVCHNGNSIHIARSALPAHLAHGDTRGSCPENTEVVMFRCVDTMDGELVVSAVSVSDNAGLLPPSLGDACADAVAELMNEDFDLARVTGLTDGETEYLFTGDDDSDDSDDD